MVSSPLQQSCASLCSEVVYPSSTNTQSIITYNTLFPLNNMLLKISMYLFNWTSFTAQLVLNSQQMLLLSSRKANTPPSSKAESNLELGLSMWREKSPTPNIKLESSVVRVACRESWILWGMKQLNEQQSRSRSRKFYLELRIFKFVALKFITSQQSMEDPPVNCAT